MNTNWIFKNSPFEMLDVAFKRLFPGVDYEAYFQPIGPDEDGEEVHGLTEFGEDGKITILVEAKLTINDSVEIFAHELAHAGVGIGQEHNEKWQKAFDDLFDEYNKIGDEMFSCNVNPPYKGEEYEEALKSLGQGEKQDG